MCVTLQLGALVSEDPEEEKRQKDFKSLLNKLTLDNYATIKDKIVAVGIASVTTLKGLIDQVRMFLCKAVIEAIRQPSWPSCTHHP